MHRNLRRQPAEGCDGSPPSDAWLFAQVILGNPIPRIVSPEAIARAKREQLERLAQFSSRQAEELHRLQAAEAEARHDRELLEWAAQISTRAEDKLRALQRQEGEVREGWRRAEQFAETLFEGSWEPGKHPRVPKGQPDGGQWVEKGAGRGAGSVAAPVQSTPIQAAAFHRGQTTAQLVAFNGAQPSTWPTTGSASSWLPRVGSGAGAGAAVGAGIGAGAFLGGLRNGSMGTYWARVPVV